MHRIGFVVAPGFSIMSFGTLAVFEFANRRAPEPFYEVYVLSETGGPVTSSLGPSVETVAFSDDVPDTLVVGNDLDGSDASPGVVDFVRRAAARARRVASTASGVFILAQAGLLDGRRATVHWSCAPALAARYPRIKLDLDRIFVVDGPIWTTAGASAGLDAVLAMIEKDLGPEVAREVARSLVLYHRPAGQAQLSALLEMGPKSDRIEAALDYARRNLRQPLTVEELAEAARLSPRQFSRAFRAETGQSPAKAVETLRLEAARLMMEQTRHPIELIAKQTGFADRERMRRAFVRTFGRPPRELRRNARPEAPA